MASFTVSRSALVAAPTEAVRPLVADLRAWQRWSPWEALDADLKRTYSGPDSGVGARYAWQGNRKAGAGMMEIVAETPQSLRLELQFLKPWRSTNQVDFTFTPRDEGTEVTWTMSGTNTGLAKVFARFMNFDKLVGPDFEQGLAKLKALAEAEGPR